jgi:carboxylate-amine ligase
MVRSMAVTPAAPPPRTGTTLRIGIEEEFHLVGLADRRLTVGGGELLERLPDDGRFKAELIDSALEINSGVHGSLDALREDLLRSRAELVAVATASGRGVLCAGTAPLASPEEVSLAPGARNARMREDYRVLADEQLICGTQVHVDCPDRGLGLARSWTTG